MDTPPSRGYAPTIPRSRLQRMIIIPETPGEQALLQRSISGLRYLLGGSVPIRFQASDGALVDASAVEQLLGAAQQGVGISRNPVVVQGPDHRRQIHQLSGQLVNVVTIQPSDHSLELGDPARVP